MTTQPHTLKIVSKDKRRRRAAPRKPPGDFVMTRQQVAELAGYAEAHATDRLVKAGRLPLPFYPFPRSPRWLRADVEKALEAMARDAQASGGVA